MNESDATARLRKKVYEDPEVPLRESVYNGLRKAILTGEIAPNERLTEVKLGNMLGTSRTPIREALRKLELEGLVQIIPRSGARVAPITEEDLRDVLEVRRSLDALSARLASRRVTTDQRQKLWETQKRFEEAVAARDKAAILRADVCFHDRITEIAGNRKLMQVMHSLADQTYRYRFEYIKDDNDYQDLLKEHRQIFEAICHGDEEAAAAACEVHINRQEMRIRSALGLEESKKGK